MFALDALDALVSGIPEKKKRKEKSVTHKSKELCLFFYLLLRYALDSFWEALQRLRIVVYTHLVTDEFITVAKPCFIEQGRILFSEHQFLPAA